MTRRILSIIPARGGSKGLAKKNIIDFNGEPLLSWTVRASLNSNYISKTVVSSDDEEIINIAHNSGAETIIRPNELSTDIASSQMVVEHTLEHYQSLDEYFDFLILLQPTSPLRDTSDIDEAFSLLFKSEASALISTYKVESKILKAFIESDDGFISGVSSNMYLFTRRQDLPVTHMSNGAIYIIDVNEFKKNKSFITNKTIAYVMPAEKSLDIDTKEDIQKGIEYMLKLKQKVVDS